MGIRQTINENPAITAAATGSVVLLAVIFIFYRLLCSGGDNVGGPVSNKAFYTIDDGKNFFVDDAGKIPPFMHEGKPAVRAQVFTCDNGASKFVSYLEKFSDEDKRKLEEALSKNTSGGAPMAMQYMGFANALMVKKPGDKNWVKLNPQTTERFTRVMQTKCPDGSANNITRVMAE